MAVKNTRLPLLAGYIAGSKVARATIINDVLLLILCASLSGFQRMPLFLGKTEVFLLRSKDIRTHWHAARTGANRPRTLLECKNYKLPLQVVSLPLHLPFA